MANLYNTTTTTATATNYSPSPPPPPEPDEISLFLQQILLRSSSSSSSPSSSSLMRRQFFAADNDHLLTENQAPAPAPVPYPDPGQIHAPDPASGCSFAAAANVSSSSVGNFDNEPDEYEYESEENVEALVEETIPKQTSSSRTSSKRSRAAEVHNLSEKRRRSRINEKMKALQNLIPNSNKTDKASMLDEAIEYLKQLQLQVQMLTMRNGLSLYPICLPEMLQQQQHSQTSHMRMDIFDTSDKFLNTNVSKENCVKQDFSATIGPKSSFKLEYSSQQNHFGPLDLISTTSSIEKVMPRHSPNQDYIERSLIGHKAISSIPIETRKSRLKESTIEACLAGGDNLISNFVNNPMFLSHFNM
ncbi:hypothetical protein ABFS82_08G051000 [Erythranthe guttata]|uniref:transcription factor SPATULA n=1 Tax=Erythranthe guttata TaxID=4155 RepID=UPI00064DCED6|nr:PREDICTED: transcription factor SPATULA [Erythranthe guttata]|eukprot:XP_012856270.1 PREDICTED: transcription factor SPATULA [Erythranthe guttata]